MKTEQKRTPEPWIANGYDIKQPRGRYVASTGPHHFPAEEPETVTEYQSARTGEWHTSQAEAGTIKGIRWSVVPGLDPCAGHIARVKELEAELKAELERSRVEAFSFREDHAKMARAVKSALGLKHWPEPLPNEMFADQVARLAGERVKELEAALLEVVEDGLKTNSKAWITHARAALAKGTQL